MLNEYQFQLVESFVKLDVNFIVIGGMALKFHTGEPTQDLDLWVPVNGSNKDRLTDALREWLQRYPSHGPPLGLDFKKLQEFTQVYFQVHFPVADVYFLDADNNLQPISPDDGIDILTGIECCLEFDVALDRSSDWIYKGVKLRVLALEDVERLRSYKSSD